MTITKENTTRKIDTLGRISIPKSMRDRMVLPEGDEVEFFMITDDNDIQYVAMTNQTKNTVKYDRAAAVLEELGCEIPAALAEKLGA